MVYLAGKEEFELSTSPNSGKKEPTMTDLVIEVLRAIIIGLILLGLLRSLKSEKIREVSGWKPLLAGFLLVFFGTLVDITDNFESLNKFIIIGDTEVQAFLEKVVGYLLGYTLLAIGVWQWLPKIIEYQKQMRADLDEAESEVKVLQGLLPICAACKKIRDDSGYWTQIEGYISERSEAEFSHGMCPDCIKELYPEEYQDPTDSEQST